MSAIAHHSRLTAGSSDGDRVGAARNGSPAGRCGTAPGASSTVLTVVLEPGESLYHAGEQPDAGYVVKTGLLRQVMLLADGRRQIMRFVFPNDILDWAEAATMPFSAEAVEHAEVRCFSRTRLEGVLSRNAAARENWKRLAEQHFHEMQRHSVVLGRLSSIERLAYFLIWLRQHADDSSDGDIHLPMARGDIADYLGVTVETVSRGFTILRDAGMIDLVNSRHIRLKKPRALSKLAGNILAVGEVDGTASTGATDGYCQAS